MSIEPQGLTINHLRAENCAFVIPDVVHMHRTNLRSAGLLWRTVSVSDVITAVCMVYNVNRDDLLGPRRARKIARPRQVAMYFCRKFCNHMSLPGIGRMIGGRDHTTIMYGAKMIEEQLTRDAELKYRCTRVAMLLDPFAGEEGEAPL